MVSGLEKSAIDCVSHEWPYSVVSEHLRASWWSDIDAYELTLVGDYAIVDRMFGTYFHPERQEDPDKHFEEIGLLNPKYPEDYLGQLAAPFKDGLDKKSA